MQINLLKFIGNILDVSDAHSEIIDPNWFQVNDFCHPSDCFPGEAVKENRGYYGKVLYLIVYLFEDYIISNPM